MKAFYALIILMIAFPLLLAAQDTPPEPTREQVYVSIKEELQLTVDIYKLQVEIMTMIMDMQRLTNMQNSAELTRQIDILRNLKVYEGKSDEQMISKLQQQLEVNRSELANASMNLSQMEARIKAIEAKIADYYARINRSAELLIDQVSKDNNPKLPATLLNTLKLNFEKMQAATVAEGMDPNAFAAFQKAAEEYLKYLDDPDQVAAEIQARNADFASAQAAQMQYAQLVAYVEAFRELLQRQVEEKGQLQKHFDEMQELPFGKTYQDRIYFDSGSVELSPEAIRVLGEFANSVPAGDDYDILITGFCDDTPIGPTLKKKYASNWELSLARSSTVVRYMLETLKFPPEKIIIAGKGEFDTANLDKADKQLSRRVEFRFVPKEKP